MHVFKGTKIAALAFFSCSVTCYSQTFQRTYGGTGTDRSFATIQASDGSYVFTGSTTTSGAGSTDVYLVKINTGAVVQWARAFGGAGAEIGYSVSQTSDAGYIVAGSTASFGAGGLDYYLLKINADGTLAWTATFGGAGDEEARSVIQTTDGGYAITGYAKSFTGGSKDVYLVKTNADASAFWGKTYGAATDFDDEGFALIQTTDGGFAIAGNTQSYQSAGNDNAYMVKTDEAGTVSWSIAIGGANSDIFYDLLQDTDGGYVAVGGAKSVTLGAGGYDIFTVKVNHAGAISWQKVVGDVNDEVALSIAPVSNGSFVVTGYTKSAPSVLSNAFVYHANSDFSDIPGIKTIGGTSNEEGKCILKTSDGGFLVSGSTSSFGAGGDEAYVIKTDNAGSSGCNTSTYLDTYQALAALGSTTGALAGTGGSSGSGGTSSNSGTNIAYNACTNTVLPVELLNFSGLYQNGKVLLTWTTTTELNNDHFEIQCTGEMMEGWNTVGRVKGVGNSSTLHNYHFSYSLLNPLHPLSLGTDRTLYFRLAQTDHNGSTEYFGPVAIRLNESENMIIYPSVSEGKFNVAITGTETLGLMCYDSFGKKLRQYVLDASSGVPAALDLSTYSNGIYFLVAETESGVLAQKVIIQKTF